MAANYIKYDRTKDLTRSLVTGLQQIRNGMLALEQARAMYLQARDGDGSLSAHYDVVAGQGGYEALDYADANAAAKASFEELDSLYSKVGTDNAVSNVRAAILQACAKHGL